MITHCWIKRTNLQNCVHFLTYWIKNLFSLVCLQFINWWRMVPYFGKHSAKIFMKGKPVRFGFKLWCLCSSDGYLFRFIPYGGASIEKSDLGLGAVVVLKLMSVMENPSRLFFDNFFSSYKLFRVFVRWRLATLFVKKIEDRMTSSLIRRLK